MDGRTFDAWTRRLVAGLPRRGALKAIAGAAVGGVAIRAVVTDVAACLEDGQFCSTNDECCGVCISFNCSDCVPKGGHGCEGDHDCCGGKMECDNGVCKKRKKNDQSVNCEGGGCKKKKKKKH